MDNLRGWRSYPGRIVFGIFVSLALFGFFFGGSSSDSQNTNSAPTAASSVEEDTSWIPTGFNQYTKDSNIAWRWATSQETKCSYSSGACWALMLVTQSGCPTSLYGEVNIFDKSDVQIDYTNNTLSVIQPLQKVKMTFDSFNEEAQTAQVAKFSCY